MEVEGKVIQSLPTQEGGSGEKSWKKGGFVIETFGKYPSTIAFDVFGDEKINDIPNILGMVVKVSFDVKSHEYNGKWFHNVTAYKVDIAGDRERQQPTGLISRPASAQPAQVAQTTQAAPQEKEEPLPF